MFSKITQSVRSLFPKMSASKHGKYEHKGSYLDRKTGKRIIVFYTRKQASTILSELKDVVNVYGFVSRADFYDLANFTSMNYIDNRYGWYDLTGARVLRTKGGYYISFPEEKEAH